MAHREIHNRRLDLLLCSKGWQLNYDSIDCNPTFLAPH